MNTYEIIISGRVQGVGFRYHAYSTAQKLQVVGNVRNLDDGTVKIILQGNGTILDQYLAQLKITPHRFMKIEDIHIKIIPTVKDYTTFSIVDY